MTKEQFDILDELPAHHPFWRNEIMFTRSVFTNMCHMFELTELKFQHERFIKRFKEFPKPTQRWILKRLKGLGLEDSGKGNPC